ncbi:hypothetical protein [Oryzicola mucosus]|uniref:Uncharacterized protein n=1 Tax=Oryzicola mucosus TaxID=2767425 RepID=A0A8J6PRL2_9HYPH|nr:hypothetical protein [Oryzicola mucosus]MBD0416985.1 hypothetical protein [Oryzicola mucosus]
MFLLFDPEIHASEQTRKRTSALASNLKSVRESGDQDVEVRMALRASVQSPSANNGLGKLNGRHPQWLKRITR